MTDATVIVPTHNRLHLLPATIDAILGQYGVSLELVVVDDGSTDGAGPWLDRLAAQDPRVKVVHHERPRRLPSARNAGMAVATGRWIAFCDDDDLWAPDKLIAQLDALQAGPARWACTASVLVDDRLNIIGHHPVSGGEVLSDLLQGNTIWSGSSVMAEATLLKQVGGFDPTLNASEDWDMWIRLARYSPLAAVDRPLLAYRQAAGSMSTDIDRMRNSRSIILARYAALAAERGVEIDDADYERFLAKQLLRAGAGKRAALIFANLAFRHQRWREAPRIAAALVAPALTDRIGSARATAAVPSDWRREAEAWLGPLRERYASPTRTPCEDQGAVGRQAAAEPALH